MRIFTFFSFCFLVGLRSFAQPVAFSCNGTDGFGYYCSSETETRNGTVLTYSSSRLSKIATADGFRTTICTAASLNVALNGLAFNPNDNFLYAVSRYDALEFSGKLYRIGENCQKVEIPVSAGGSPSTPIVNYRTNDITTIDNGGGNISSGTFDNDNNYYVNTSYTETSKTGFTNKIQKIKINGSTASVVSTFTLDFSTFPRPTGVTKLQINDIIFDQSINALVGSNRTTGKLYKISTVNGKITEIGTTGISRAVLGLFKNRSGLVRAIDEDGKIYSVNTTSGAFSNLVTATDIRSRNADAASGCYELKIVPVELLSLEGTLRDGKAMIKWQTASEINNDYFEVEKLETGVGFKAIGRVAAVDILENVNDYEFTDRTFNGEGFYRLNQVDFDGSSTLSKIITVKNRKSNSQVQLTVLEQSMNIEMRESGKLEIFNSGGLLLERVKLTEGSNNIDISNYKNQVVFLVVIGKNGDQLITEKVVKI